MPTAVAGPEIERLIQLLARLPGLGPRSARRAALHLIKKREPLMAPLSAALQTALDKIQVCRICGNIDTQNPCTVCTDPRRDPSIIVAVADVADLVALERAGDVCGQRKCGRQSGRPSGDARVTKDCRSPRCTSGPLREVRYGFGEARGAGGLPTPSVASVLPRRAASRSPQIRPPWRRSSG